MREIDRLTKVRTRLTSDVVTGEVGVRASANRGGVRDHTGIAPDSRRSPPVRTTALDTTMASVAFEFREELERRGFQTKGLFMKESGFVS